MILLGLDLHLHRLVAHTLQLNCNFRYRFLQQQLWFRLIAVGVSQPCTSFRINVLWGRNCRILKLNVTNVNSEYCVKRVNFIFYLGFIHYKDVLFKNYDLRSSDVKKTQFWRQNSISYVLMVSMMFVCCSSDKMVQ